MVGTIDRLGEGSFDGGGVWGFFGEYPKMAISREASHPHPRIAEEKPADHSEFSFDCNCDVLLHQKSPLKREIEFLVFG